MNRAEILQMDRLSQHAQTLQERNEFHILNTQDISITPDMEALILLKTPIEPEHMGTVETSTELPVAESRYESLLNGGWNERELMPIYVSPFREGKYQIMDGRHRYCLYVAHGYENIPVLVR